MHRPPLLTLVSAFAIACLPHSAALAGEGIRGANVPEFQVRPGYRVTLVAEGIRGARFLEFDDRGTLFVSQPRQGTIHALRDEDGDGTYETSRQFVTATPGVHCMHFTDGWLYFTSSETGAAHKARDTDADGVADEIVEVLPPNSVPAGGGHPFRAILVTGDSVYISVSDPRNMTPELESDRKAIYRFDKEGKSRSLFASGIRNTEKLRLRPGTSEVWGVDHGSDHFGRTYGESEGRQPITDLNPPEELNHYVEGGFYGHPYLTGNRVPRPEFADRKDIIDLAERTIPPAWSFGAHWAGNGFTFLESEYFPGHKGDLFVAFHGSWNSSVPVGYCVERVLFDEVTGRPYGSLTVVRALDANNRVLARPVDCVEAPDGSVIFSCDQTGRIYRIGKAE
jgi:glucose/arabinose dehydrogenase